MLFEAIYFDGKSVISYQVSGTFQEARREISFSHKDKTLRILLDYDCIFGPINNELTIHVKDSAAQLVISDTQLIKTIGRQKSQSWNTNLYHKLIDGGMGLHVFIVFLILSLILFVNFYMSPAAAEKAVVLIPDSYDMSLGYTFFKNYKKYNIIDEEKSELAQKFTDELIINSTKEIKVNIVESNEINPFALLNRQNCNFFRHYR